jgi:hypothetical protein
MKLKKEKEKYIREKEKLEAAVKQHPEYEQDRDYSLKIIMIKKIIMLFDGTIEKKK